MNLETKIDDICLTALIERLMVVRCSVFRNNTTAKLFKIENILSDKEPISQK